MNKRDFFYVDLKDSFTRQSELYGQKTLMAGGIDVHPGETTHRLIADKIAPVLDKMKTPAC